jgi:hypothetical protein
MTVVERRVEIGADKLRGDLRDIANSWLRDVF